ncbi:Ubiquitin [Oryctes borbonicus]|uniref:Ubiquitin n=1 Tax=Oryctes borbonicus TaxID=1629725 RepID=A0A0T6B0J6_9SCAR|nr:Ubiquitin [Oryctes borbonicus]
MGSVGTESENQAVSLEDNCEKPNSSVEKVEEQIESKVTEQESGDSTAIQQDEEPSELIDVKVVYNKNKYDVSVATIAKIGDFKKQLQGLLGVPDSMQKLMYKGLLQDSQTIKSSGITKGAKIMLVGSTLNDVLEVSSVTKEEVVELEKASNAKEPLCKQKLHKKVLDKGVPEDVMPGIKNSHESLPPFPLSGMVNKHGGKVRLTFKLESDQLWLSTKDRTEKLPMGSIKNIVSEPILEHEEYHIMGLQLGPTEASRYWIYWVPAQFIEAIKNAVLGTWQIF